MTRKQSKGRPRAVPTYNKGIGLLLGKLRDRCASHYGLDTSHFHDDSVGSVLITEARDVFVYAATEKHGCQRRMLSLFMKGRESAFKSIDDHYHRGKNRVSLGEERAIAFLRQSDIAILGSEDGQHAADDGLGDQRNVPPLLCHEGRFSIKSYGQQARARQDASGRVLGRQ